MFLSPSALVAPRYDRARASPSSQLINPPTRPRVARRWGSGSPRLFAGICCTSARPTPVKKAVRAQVGSQPVSITEQMVTGPRSGVFRPGRDGPPHDLRFSSSSSPTAHRFSGFAWRLMSSTSRMAGVSVPAHKSTTAPRGTHSPQNPPRRDRRRWLKSAATI